MTTLPERLPPSILVDLLAKEIRRVDGSHSLGAAALAEALMPFVAALQAAPEGVAWVEVGQVTGTYGDGYSMALLDVAKCPVGTRLAMLSASPAHPAAALQAGEK